MRCGVHGLAAGPDGSCALCRRGKSVRPSEKRLSPLGIALGAIALLCVSAIGYTALRRALAPTEAALMTESITPSASTTATSQTEAEVEETPELAAVRDTPPEPVAEPAAFSDAPAAFTATPALSPRTSALATSAPAPAPTTRSLVSRTATAEQLRAAMRRVPVTLYATNWCKHCERARAFMRANSIPFVEHDVEASESAKRAQKALNPAGGVPTIDVDGHVLVGFNEAKAIQALVAAAQRRMP
jgi:glutaredoxin 3